MDAADIAALCAVMSLKELEGPVRRLEGDLKTDGNQKDRRRVLIGEPWSFDNFLIVLAKPNGKGDILNIPFNKTAFWVQIHNVPLLCMTKQIGSFLGSLIGDVEEIDEGVSGDYDGKFLRVRVIINVDQPLRRILQVDVLGDREESVMLLRYEWLPDHCHRHTHHTITKAGESIASAAIFKP
ncbi:hypothetical protein EZV62_018689 [Acer yangbiense]|uniref:Uncharacterized protein n=1 Tax=Acer yangbiense TaxID=1000413 RepID=A0A5C7HM53_9ROSI|nr:hypothetical protein EZV62_018689 [Acer yangbiense]